MGKSKIQEFVQMSYSARHFPRFLNKYSWIYTNVFQQISTNYVQFCSNELLIMTFLDISQQIFKNLYKSFSTNLNKLCTILFKWFSQHGISEGPDIHFCSSVEFSIIILKIKSSVINIELKRGCASLWCLIFTLDIG